MATGNQSDNLRIVLVRTRNPLNIGAAARAASNFGFANLRLVNPYPVAFREARSAVGAKALLAQAQEFSTVAEAVGDCALVVGTTAARRRELQQPLRGLAEGAKLIRAQLCSRPVALLFGSEKTGLSNEDVSHCHWLMHIPTHATHVSMNLGQAVAVCLYELSRVRHAKGLGTTGLATASEAERLTTVLLEALEAAGYLKRTSAMERAKIRRFVRRFQLQPGDAALLLGMLRQILWKLDSPSAARR